VKLNLELPNIIQVIKSKMRWGGHVACMGDRRGAHRVLVGRREGKKHLEDRDVDVRTTLRWSFMK